MFLPIQTPVSVVVLLEVTASTLIINDKCQLHLQLYGENYTDHVSYRHPWSSIDRYPSQPLVDT